jgi:hypothetical protein
VRNLILALCAIAAVCGAITTTPARAQAPTVSAYPLPGTPTASPKTQISFRGVPASALGAIAVSGSRSGAHAGTLRAHPDGQGASFFPTKPFEPGERVTVRTALNVVGATAGDFGFTIADTARQPPTRAQPGTEVGNGAVQTFATRPDLKPAAITVTTSKPGVAPGLVFLTPAGGRGQEGETIIDNAGRTVWFKPVPTGGISSDFRVQTYQGNPVLTWWQGKLIVGDGRGVGEIYDTSYRPVATVKAGNGYSMDIHEFQLTPRGTALILSYNRVNRNLSAYHGSSRAEVVDNIIQEVDIKTGLVLFEWHSLGNIALAESEVPAPPIRGAEWDYLHMNSVSETADGNLLVSARNSWGIYKISRTTGKVLWRLGGRKPDFKMGAGTTFAFQHDAREQPDGTITVFDDSAAPPVRKHSRALTIALDTTAHTATLKSALAHPKGLLTATQGGVQPLPNGDTFVGWGSQGYFSEFSPTGALLFDGHVAVGNASYRAYRMPWSGQPADLPKAVATTKGGTVTARASWNGATGIARWQLLAGPNAGALTAVGEASWAGFETAISAATAQPLVAMRAFDAQGNVLATSAPVKPSSG